MKTIGKLAFALCTLLLCLTAHAGTKDEKAAQVKKAVDDRNVTIIIRTIFPQTGTAVVPTSIYEISIKDGKINGTLPFFGTSTRSVYGNEDISLHFEECPIEISEKVKKDEVQWKFEAQSGYDRWQVSMKIFDNGNVSINCLCPSRSQMNYNGYIDIDTDR